MEINEAVSTIFWNRSLVLCVKKTERGTYIFEAMHWIKAFFLSVFSSWASSKQKVWAALHSSLQPDELTAVQDFVKQFLPPPKGGA